MVVVVACSAAGSSRPSLLWLGSLIVGRVTVVSWVTKATPINVKSRQHCDLRREVCAGGKSMPRIAIRLDYTYYTILPGRLVVNTRRSTLVSELGAQAYTLLLVRDGL